MFLSLFFFFQAEDGIRDVAVTGVQTCALPIFFAILRRSLPTRRVSSTKNGISASAKSESSQFSSTMPITVATTVVKIGRASCRGRVEISVVAVSLKKKKKKKQG